jgi:S-DNA-T family DNA segregation ATPase FtsK/SpoIIIE
MIQPNRSSDHSVDSNARSPESLSGTDPVRGMGLLTHVRQGRWLRGLSHRCQKGAVDRHAIVERQANDTASLQAILLAEHEHTLTGCRTERKSVLSKWDHADEQTIATYESQTIATRNQMNHDLAALRKKRKHDIAAEEQWYDTEVNQVQTHYAEEKPKPGLQHKQELSLIEKRSVRLHEIREAARELTMRRIGGPKGLERLNAATVSSATVTSTTVSSAESTEPHDSLEHRALRTLKECLAELDRLGDTSEGLLADLRSGWTVKFLESYYLLIVMIAVAAVWAGGTFLIGPERLALWMLAGIPAAVVVGLITHTLLGFPLRKKTKAIHPEIERGFLAGLKLIEHGKQLSNARAKQWAAELVRNRDQTLEQLRLSHAEKMQGIKDRYQADHQQTTADFEAKLATIEQTFQETYAAQSRQMFAASEETALRLAARLADTDRERQQRLDSQNDSHQAEIEFLRLRVEQGIRQGLQRVRENQQIIEQRFPDWGHILAEHESDAESLRWLPLGDLDIAAHVRGVLDDPSIDIPASMPLVLPRESQSTVVIDCPPDQMHVAAEWVRAVLWRGLTAVRPGRLRLTLLDPVGRGQNFASLVSLGDHDPLLIGYRAWVSAQQIQERLTELTQHIEDVLQACLRDRYQTIEDFNRDAGPLAEPYRVLAAFGLPIGLNRDSAESLRALIEGGRRCGVYSILVRDTSQPWSSDLPSLPDSQVLRLRIDEMGRIWHAAPGLESFQVSPIDAPPATAIPMLSERIGQGAIAAHRVEIPLDDCIPANEYDSGSSAKGLSIPVGRQGVGRFLEIQLGTGMRQHMLVAGKTGSGKSTLLHSLIMAASLKYSPEELQLYLLDFKKGVEFKIYAEAQLPHARVIGIESEREFGRSVLQRLDEELQRRGELFRAAGVQDLADYRHHSQNTLPRILFIVDEFQELFVRDDRVAQECTMLLDRLVRQGRSFGMHVVLSSQSLSGAYTLPRATLGQMAIRIALQCSESDAALILADDNTAARLLSRPGEAIFNDAGGLIEGNQPFQVPGWDKPFSENACKVFLIDIPTRRVNLD